MAEATTVLVVGGGRGIGRSLVAALEARGHRVDAVDGERVDLTHPPLVGAALRSAVQKAAPAVVVVARSLLNI